MFCFSFTLFFHKRIRAEMFLFYHKSCDIYDTRTNEHPGAKNPHLNHYTVPIITLNETYKVFLLKIQKQKVQGLGKTL